MADRSVRVRLIAEVNSYLAGMRQAGKATTDFTKDLSGAGKSSKEDVERIGRAGSVMALGLVGAFTLAERATVGFDKQISELGAAANASGKPSYRPGG